jgi:hypothetical protein
MQIYNKKILPDEPSLPSGQINLLISRFTQQDIVTVDTIIKAIDRLPGFHLQGLREILYAPELAPVPYGIEAYARHMRPPRKLNSFNCIARSCFTTCPTPNSFSTFSIMRLAIMFSSWYWAVG